MSSDEIDYLMSQPDGANYVVLYQMLCLKTINTDGCLVSKIGEMLIPYDAEKIQRECKWFPLSTVRLALTVYKQIGLIFENPDGTLSISDYQNMIGSETDWAAKNRKIRSNAANRELQAGHGTGHATGHNVSTGGGENVPTEKEIEKDTRGKRQEEDIEADVTAPNGAVCRTGDVRRVVEAWNSLGINPIMKITGSSTRGGMLRARISEYGVDAVINAIAQINDSSFLKGQNKSGWTVSFDWFVRPNNFLKVMEGRYSDSPHGSQPTHNGVPVDYGSPEDFYK